MESQCLGLLFLALFGGVLVLIWQRMRIGDHHLLHALIWNSMRIMNTQIQLCLILLKSPVIRVHALLAVVRDLVLFAVNKEFSLFGVYVLDANGMAPRVNWSKHTPLQSFVKKRILKKIRILFHNFGCQRRTIWPFLTLRIPLVQIPILEDFEDRGLVLVLEIGYVFEILVGIELFRRINWLLDRLLNVFVDPLFRPIAVDTLFLNRLVCHIFIKKGI